jgi:hypothetical protein
VNLIEDNLNLIHDLTRIIQRIEKEGYDITSDDIQTVWKAKTKLGYSNPVSIEQGTGSMLPQIKVEKLEYETVKFTDLSQEGQEEYNKIVDSLYKDTGIQAFYFANACKNCSCNPSNGGSGNCNCTLNTPIIT